MKITHLKKYSPEQMISKLKKVILLNSEKTGKPIYVYKNAKIELIEVKIKDLFPLQTYQLVRSNQLVYNLYDIFQKKYKHDILNMDGYVTYNSGGKRYALVPPIIECVANSKIIIDGLHRVLLAKKMKRKAITVIAIGNVPEKLFLPAAPNSWEELKVVEIAPESKHKRKWLVSPEKGYLYYRNFQSVFQNVGKPRFDKKK